MANTLSIQIHSAQCRFVLPFRYQDGVRVETLQWKGSPVWLPAPQPKSDQPLPYSDHLLPGFSDYYTHGRLYVLENQLRNKWLGQAMQVHLPGGSLPLIGEPDPPILYCSHISKPLDYGQQRQSGPRVLSKDLPPPELFLGPHGVGVLSISLSPLGAALSLSQLKRFNNKLAQSRLEKAAFLCPVNAEPDLNPKPASPKQQAVFPESHQYAIRESILNGERDFSGEVLGQIHAPLAQIPGQPVGRQGQWFALAELADFLLSPFGTKFARPSNATAKESSDPHGETFLVYTAVRLPPQWIASSVARPSSVPEGLDLAANATALAQVEEEDHPFPISGAPGAACEILDTHSVIAASIQGVAQLYTEQVPEPEFPAEHAFNESLLHRAMISRWPAFLAALVQRETFLLLRSEFEQALQKPKLDQISAIAALRRKLLLFTVQGFFTEISSQDALNRLYDTIQRGLRVHAHRALLQNSLTAFEAGEVALAQQQMQEETRGLQTKAEWIELLILLIYSVELTHIFTTLFGWREVPAGVASAAVMALTGFLYWLFSGFPGTAPVLRLPRAPKLVFAGLLLPAIIAGLWYAGDHFFPRNPEPRSSDATGSRPSARATLLRIETVSQSLVSPPAARFAQHPRVHMLVEQAWRNVGLAQGEQGHAPNAQSLLESALANLEEARTLAGSAQTASEAQAQFESRCPSSCTARIKNWPQVKNRLDRAWTEGEFATLIQIYSTLH